MANTEKVNFKEGYEQSTRRINFLKNVKLPEIEKKLQKACKMLSKVEKDKRMAGTRVKYIKQVNFYSNQKEKTKKELEQYEAKQLYYRESLMSYPVEYYPVH